MPELVEAPRIDLASPSIAAAMRRQQQGEPVFVELVPHDCDLAAAGDEFVQHHPGGTMFHLSGWRRAVQRSFGHADLTLLARQDGRVAGILPLMLVKSWLGGRMLVSVPYGVAGGVLADQPAAGRALYGEAKRLVEKHRSRLLDLRSERATVNELAVRDTHVGFRRQLPASADAVLKWLPRKTRAAARNARDKYQLHVDYDDNALPLVHGMYARNMRRLASICYPLRFFRSLREAFADHCWVSLVTWRDRPVAGLVSFLHGDTVLPYFFGCTADARICHAANFIYFKLMERATAAGYRWFDFGRTRVDNRGNFDFKRFHGFDARPLEYQQFVPSGVRAPDLSPGNQSFRLARRIWPKLPLAVTTMAGAVLSRHIPG